MRASSVRGTLELDFVCDPESILRQARKKKRMADQARDEEFERLRAEMARMQIEMANRDAEARREREQRIRLEAQINTQPRNARQYMHPELKVPEPAIVLPEVARNFEIKTQFISLIKREQFHGRPNECPIEHVKQFKDLCETISTDDETLEYVLLKAFKWSLGGKALHWLESQAPRSITSWRALNEAFLMKFFPPTKTTELRRKIASFQQGAHEPLFEAWDRFKEMLRACPTHGQQPYVLQDIFFQGINPATKDKLNLHTDCGFIDLPPEQAWELLDKLSDCEAIYGVNQVSKEVRVHGDGPKRLYDPKST